jgi:Transposase, Mutator family
VHFLRNALDHLPRKADDDCLQELRWLDDRRSVEEARRDLAAWIANAASTTAAKTAGRSPPSPLSSSEARWTEASENPPSCG